MVEVRRVGILSFALMYGLISAAIGLLLGLLFACVSILGFSFLATALEDLVEFGGGGIVVSLLYAVCLPLIYGIMGFIGGAIIAALYNVIAGFAGGVKVELKEENLAKAPEA